MDTALQQLQRLSSTENPSCKYKKGELIGKGGMGFVFKAKSYEGAQQIAIKYMKISTPQNNRMILNELTVLKKFPHPNISAFIDCYLNDTNFWLMMEYIEGINARRLIAAGWPVPAKYISTICGCALKALAFLHENNVIHRDVKPENIMLSTSGCVKLIDMGLSTRTTLGMNLEVGTPPHMAPELYIGNNYDCPVDIWAIGITVYVLSCIDPYPGHSMQTMRCRMKEMHPPDMPESFTPRMRDFVQKCLLIDPWMRPPAFYLLNHRFITSNGASKQDMADLLKTYLNT